MDGSNKILYANFNQSGKCLCVGTEIGFKIFKLINGRLECKVDKNLGGGIGIVETLDNTNIFALVGGGLNPKFPNNRVIVWDELQTIVLCEIQLDKNCTVLNVKLNLDYLFIVTEQKVFVHSVSDHTFGQKESLTTIANPKGLFSMVTVRSGEKNENLKTIIAFPDKTQGHLRLKFYDSGESKAFKCCESNVNCFKFSSDGTVIATTSEKGTIIRLFRTSDNEQMIQLRRGSNHANIFDFCFSPNSLYLISVSSTGTTHFFSLGEIKEKIKSIKTGAGLVSVDDDKEDLPEQQGTVMKSLTSFAYGMFGGGFQSQNRSFTEYKLNKLNVKTNLAFGADHEVMISTYDGNFNIVKFDKSSCSSYFNESIDYLSKSKDVISI